MATIIALTNQKGGVGKTTSTSALAAGLAQFYHKKVLAVDLDPQGSLGFSLGLNIEDCKTIYDVFTGSATVQEAIQHTKYCDILTSNIMLSSAELKFQDTNRELLLQEALAPIQANYDYIVIDTPPALNILTVNAYAASDYLIIPMAPEILSLLGVSQLKETIDSVRTSLNPCLNVLGLLLTRFNSRTLLAREVEDMTEKIASQIGTQVFAAKIRPSVSVAEAPAHGLSIFDYARLSKPAADYKVFVKEVLRTIARLEGGKR